MRGIVKCGLVAIVFGVALGGAAFIGGRHLSAQGGRPGGPGGPGFGMGPGGPGGRGGAMGLGAPMMFNRLDLTQDQRDRMKQIVDSHRDEQNAIGQRAKTAHDALDAVVTAGSFDEAAIRARAADVAAVDADITVARARIYTEMLQVLTADQVTKLKTLQTEMRARQDKVRARRGQRP